MPLFETLASLASIPNFTLNNTVGVSTGSSFSGNVVINVDPNVPARDRTTELAAQRSITGAMRDEEHVTLLMKDALSGVPPTSFLNDRHSVKGIEPDGSYDTSRIGFKIGKLMESAAKAGKPITHDEASKMVYDGIRYSVHLDTPTYANDVRSHMNALRAHGCELEQQRNYWNEPVYHAYHTVWREPLTNRLFEVQYHTHEGSNARRTLRPQFFIFRSPVSDEKRAQVSAQMKAEWAKVPVPPGALGLGALTTAG